MTTDERRIATAALRAGTSVNHDEIVLVVADQLNLDPQRIEDVLRRLRVRQVLNCVSTEWDVGAVSVRYEKGTEWTEEE
jgi:hypothetical protein